MQLLKTVETFPSPWASKNDVTLQRGTLNNKKSKNTEGKTKCNT